MGFASGFEEAEKLAEKHRSHGSSRAEYLRIEEGESVIVRFVPQPDGVEIFSVLQYNYIPTKQPPAWWNDGGKTRKWPQRISAVCRLDEGLEGKYSDDPLRDMGESPSPRVWAWCVLREEVMEDGRVVGVRDVKETVERDGQKVESKAFRMVNQAHSNFFNLLRPYSQRYGTLVDRDYQITRVDRNSYAFLPLDKIEGHDLRDPEVYAMYEPPFPLYQEVHRLASDEFYALFIDPNRTPAPPKDSGGGSGGGAPAEQQQARPSGDASPEALDAIRNRIMGSGDSESQEQGESAPAATGGGMRNYD